MRIRLFTLSVFLAFAASHLAYAQNVLVPSDSGSASKPITSVTPPPAVKLTLIPAQETKPSDISKLFNNPFSPETQKSIDQISTPYMQPEQQQAMIQRTQQSMARLQESLGRLQRSAQMVNANASNAKTQQEKNFYGPLQENVQKSSAQIYDQLQKDQRRLDILQSGPLKATDLMSLYQM